MVNKLKQIVKYGRLFVLPVLLLLPGRAGAVLPSAPVPPGCLVGQIKDVVSGEQIGWVTLLLEEINRSVAAHEDGTFHFYDVPPGDYTLKSFRVGYQDAVRYVRITSKDTLHISMQLRPADLYTESVLVEAIRSAEDSELHRTDIEVTGKKLRQNLGGTIAETIDYEPGVAQRTMGPAPARPVLRGLSGDRLLVLEDGNRTGDLSATASDHAVVVEPMTAERIEVIRGPAALIYGSNTLGGVVNVHREYIPNSKPHRLTAGATMQGESVNSGFAAGGNLTFPVECFAIHADGSYRKSQNQNTPLGELLNTDLETKNASLGASYICDWGYVGIAGNIYNSAYGIPPDPLGGHPGGVNIDLERTHQQAKLEFFKPSSWYRRVEIEQSFTKYFHAEYESNGELGVEFGVVTNELSAKIHTPNSGQFENGQFGVWMQHRDYASGGLNFTPDTRELSAAVFGYQEIQWSEFSFNLIGRYDIKSITPAEKRYSEYLEGEIRDVNFSGVSGGISGHYHFSDDLYGGVSLVRSFRAPAIEEMFSEGPHLAAYAYEVGNANLGIERGLGLESFIQYRDDHHQARLAIYRNGIDGYIFPQNTNQRSYQRNDLYVYRFVGLDALMYGAEATWDLQLHDDWRTGGSISYVNGTLVQSKQPLPLMPPLEGKISVRYNGSLINYGTTVRAAARQDRPAEFETSTDGYVVFDLYADYIFSSGDLLHTVSLKVENLTDQVYRKHLNRVKNLMPEAGRNIKLLYKVFL
jgi:iron complex outermembrane receptor protein